MVHCVCGEMSDLAALKNPLNFLDRDPDVDDFQNSISSSLFNVLSFYEDPISSCYVKLLTAKYKKRTKRQTKAVC